MKRACLLMMAAVVGLMAVPEYTNMSPDTEIDHGPALPYLGNRSSPGVEVGITDYDFQQNGSMGRYVAISPLGGFHFYWTYEYDSTTTNRRAYYNYHYPPDYWLGGLAMDNDQSRMGALDMMADGRALGSAHASVTGGYACRVYLDAT